ncbi:MAG: hypothetical protein ACE5ES_01090, partial [Candidatus Nanoarchaeia archaeon]
KIAEELERQGFVRDLLFSEDIDLKLGYRRDSTSLSGERKTVNLCFSSYPLEENPLKEDQIFAYIGRRDDFTMVLKCLKESDLESVAERCGVQLVSKGEYYTSDAPVFRVWIGLEPTQSRLSISALISAYDLAESYSEIVLQQWARRTNIDVHEKREI